MTHPTRLGKYQITEILGEGAMGVVYKGFDPDIRRVVALKTIRHGPGDSGDGAAGLEARFRNEAQAAGRLSHPGIVAVYDFGRHEGIAYMAMEYVEGRALAHVLAHHVRFEDADIPGLMTQLLDALHHAHEQGVWHRDVKPGNVILAASGRVKVADFGIARIEASALTQVHALIGTPSYMAPEQFTGAAIDRRVDIYAAGTLLYALLVGRPPFAGTPEALMYQAVHEAPVPPSRVDGVRRPAFYDALLARALAKDPAQRYASAAAFRQAIEEAAGRFDPRAWEGTVMRAALPPRARPVPVAGASTAPPTHWDRAQLQQVEASLARFVGPLATLLVRRAARECGDLASLYARLADQVTHPAARAAFLSRAPAAALEGSDGAARPAASGSRGARATFDDRLLENARRLLAAQVGPIAGVVVKRAAAGTHDRQAFFAAIAQSVDDAGARKRLLVDLARLP